MAVIPSSNTIRCTLLPRNAPFLLFVLYILVTVEGIEISVMPVQFRKALPFILVKPSGSVIPVRLVQSENADCPMLVTVSGITTSCSDPASEHAVFGIDVIPASNITLCTELLLSA